MEKFYREGTQCHKAFEDFKKSLMEITAENLDSLAPTDLIKLAKERGFNVEVVYQISGHRVRRFEILDFMSFVDALDSILYNVGYNTHDDSNCVRINGLGLQDILDHASSVKDLIFNEIDHLKVELSRSHFDDWAEDFETHTSLILEQLKDFQEEGVTGKDEKIIELHNVNGERAVIKAEAQAILDLAGVQWLELEIDSKEEDEEDEEE